MTHDVFLCYTAVDKPTAGLVRGKLADYGVRCYDPFTDTTAGGSIISESLAAISSARALLYILSDEGEADSSLAKQLDAARRTGVGIVTLRLSGENQWAKFDQTEAHIIDSGKEELASCLDFLCKKTLETLASAGGSESKEVAKRGRDSAKAEKFTIPGFGSGKWIVSLIAMMIYVLSASIIVLSAFSLRSSENFREDALVLFSFITMILVPVLLIGNFMGLRDRLPVLRKRKPFLTAVVILLIDGLIFLFFDLIFFFLERAR